MVGVFGAEMAVSFRSSRVGLKAGIFGQPKLGWRLPLGGPIYVL